jgi:XapX domain-containing protein
MKPYAISLGVGFLVGVAYALVNVRSPAPPVIALIGLLGMLLGEQIVPITKRVVAGEPVTSAWVRNTCVEHVFGQLPGAISTSNAVVVEADGGASRRRGPGAGART